MSKKFIFFSGLFFFIPFLGAMEQENKLSDINVSSRTFHRILQRDPILAVRVFRYIKVENRKKILCEMKRIDASKIAPKWGFSGFRYKPYQKFH